MFLTTIPEYITNVITFVQHTCDSQNIVALFDVFGLNISHYENNQMEEETVHSGQ